MRAVVVGPGTVGSAISKLLKQHAHQVVAVDRKSGDFQADKNTATRVASARLVGKQETEKWGPIVSGWARHEAAIPPRAERVAMGFIVTSNASWPLHL